MGFPRTITNAQIIEARILRDRGVKWEEVARRVGASRAGLARWLAKPEDAPTYPRPCGENAAYYRHLARGEVTCARCTEAHRVYRHEAKIKAGVPVLADVGPTRDLVVALLRHMTQVQLARETGLSTLVIRRIRDGAVARVLPSTADAVARVAGARLPEEVES